MINLLDDKKSGVRRNADPSVPVRKNRRVALIGLDGSGKTTNINLMKKDDDFNCFHFVWVRWKPLFLKPVYVLMKQSLKRTNSHAQEIEKTGLKKKIFKSRLVRQVWLKMALADYFIQFQLKVLKLVLLKRNIIFDRYYIDLFVDKGINFGYAPDRIMQEIERFHWLFPRIDQYIYIKVSPDSCIRRKEDIPDINYLVQRHAAYECLARAHQWSILDGEEPLEDVKIKIKRMILG